MKKRNKELIKNTVILGIGQLVPKLFSLLLLPLLTAYLTTDEYGNYDLIMSFSNLLIPVVTLQIQQGVFRYLIASKTFSEERDYITSSIVYVLISSLILYPFIFFILRFLNLSFFNSILICLLFWNEAVFNLLGQIVRGIGANKKYSISAILFSGFNLLFSAFFLIVHNLGLLGVIISIGLSYLCSNIYLLFFTKAFKFISFKEFNFNSLKELIRFSLPIVPSSIALWVVNLSDRLIIIAFLGAGANGIYGVANKIPSMYAIAYNIFNLAWVETASRAIEDEDPVNYYSELFNKMYKFLVGFMLLLIAATPFLFKILVKGDFTSSITQVPLLYLGVFFNSFVNFYSGIYLALKRTKQVGYSSIAGAVLNIIINLLLINRIGLYAASLSTALSFLIIALYRAFDLNKVIKIKYHFKKLAVGMVFLLLSSLFLFSNNFYLLIINILIAVIYNLKNNLELVQSFLKSRKLNS